MILKPTSALWTVILLSGCGADAPPPAAPPTGGTSPLNVDNLSDQMMEVRVGSRSLGQVKPFEVGVYELSEGAHDVAVFGPKGEIDRATVKIARGKTSVFNPGARGGYFLEDLTYASRPVLTGSGYGGMRGREVRGQKVVEGDFGLGAAVPATVAMDKEGMTQRTKLHRLPPAKLTSSEALAYLKVPRESFLGDATHVAFEALLAAKDVAGATICLERDGTLALESAFQKLWEAGLDPPEAKLAAWVVAGPPAGRDSRATVDRAMYAALMLAEKGKLDAASRLPAERVADLRNVRFEHLFKILPAARGQALYRGMLTLCSERAWHALWFGWIKPDEETVRRIDAHIRSLGPDKGESYGRNKWLEARQRSADAGGAALSFEMQLEVLDAASPGTAKGQAAGKILSSGRYRELAAALPALLPETRRALYHQFTQVRGQAKLPATADEVAFLDAGLKEKDDLIRKLLIQGVVSSLHHDRDPRLIDWARGAVEKEPNEKNKKNLASLLNAILAK